MQGVQTLSPSFFNPGEPSVRAWYQSSARFVEIIRINASWLHFKEHFQTILLIFVILHDIYVVWIHNIPEN
jgi:hypothetical protein